MKQLGGGEHAGERGRGGVEKCKKLRVAVWFGNKEMQGARARVFRTGKLSFFSDLSSFELRTRCKAR
jgi:hypothetical protein